MRVLICVPNWRFLGLECHRGLLQIAACLDPSPRSEWGAGSLLWGGVRYEVDFLYAANTNIPFAREFFVDQALDREADFTVHVDSDTGFEMEHVFSLLELLTVPGEDGSTWGPADPIVLACAPIPLRAPPHNIAAFPFPVTQTKPRDWWAKQPEMVEVAATGLGLAAFTVHASAAIDRPLFPVFDNRFGAVACPVGDLPDWLTTPHARVVGSDVAFTSRLASNVGRVVVDNRRLLNPPRHIVEVTLAPFEITTAESGGDAGRECPGGPPGVS